MLRKNLTHTNGRQKPFILFCLILSGFLFFTLSACQQNGDQEKATKEGANVVTDSISDESAVPIEDTSLMALKEFAGAYPSDVNLLDQPELKERLKSLLGDEYTNFRKYWETETPVELEKNILVTTGCEQHNCAANQFVLQIDLNHNNINVFHFGQGGIQSYLENGPITLPPGLAKEFQTITENNKQ